MSFAPVLAGCGYVGFNRNAPAITDSGTLNDSGTVSDSGTSGPCNGVDDDGDGKADEFKSLVNASWSNAAPGQPVRAYFHYASRNAIYGLTGTQTIVKWNGSSWSTLTNTTGLPPNGLVPMFVFLAENDIWALGDDLGLNNRTAYQWNGSSWVYRSASNTTNSYINSLQIQNPTFYYGLGNENADGSSTPYTFTFTAGDWVIGAVLDAYIKVTKINAGNKIYKYSRILSNTEMYAVNADTGLLSVFNKTNAGQWDVLASGKQIKPYFKFVSTKEVYAVGLTDNIVYGWDGADWTALSPPLANIVYFDVIRNECDGAVYAISDAAQDNIKVVD